MTQVQGAVLYAYQDRRREPAPLPAGASLELSSIAAPGIHLSVYDNLNAAEQIWRRFEPRTDCTIFQTFDYLAAWQRHIGARENIAPAIVVGRRAGGEILFLLPLAVEDDGLVRRLIWHGHDLCDYLAPLLAADFSRSIAAEKFVALWREIGTLLQRHPRLRHDLVELRKMPERVGAQANPFLQLSVLPHPSGAHLAKLQGDWESFYVGKRSSATRRRDRSKRKRLAEFGEIRLLTPTDDGEIIRTIEILIRQKSGALARMGAADLFARPGVRDFYHDLATDPRTRERVHVSRLEIGATPASTNLGFQYRGRYYYVLASYDEGEISRFGPGAAHLRELMQRACELGLGEFDFTVGDESYKYEWSDTETRLYDHLAAVTARGIPVVILLRGLAWAKRTIKQTALLWRAYRGLRAAIAWLTQSRARAGR
jgi:CelD/BcsL family acetyltransferase involved in cellulose biosynthesis